jgi:hypothetical protein
MILENGNIIGDSDYEVILDDMLEEIILNFVGYGMEGFDDAVEAAQDMFTDKSSVHSIDIYQEDVPIAIGRVKQAALEFSNELAKEYGRLSKKFIGTKSWEKYRSTEKKG